MKQQRIAILGAGAWGTALAALWEKNGHKIVLWGNNADRVADMQRTRENRAHLPGIKLPTSIGLTTNMADCDDVDLAVFVTPSTAMREIVTRFRDKTGDNDRRVLLSCTKGIEYHTGLRMSQILGEVFPDGPIAVLSGPNLADEVIRELPTATVLACTKSELASQLQAGLGTPRFRVYTGDDLAGIEIGGALKNIFAIAAGAGDGLGLGDNTKAALVTRALAEMVRLGTAMGGKVPTFYGLSGAGDLIATCFSKLSRNRRLGEELARGRSLDEITMSIQTVPEGVPTTKSAFECARRLKVDTPIIDQVHALLHEGRAPAQAMEELLGREPKPERI